MASVATLPTARSRTAAAGCNPRNAGTSGIYDVAGRLGQAHRPPAWICRTLDAYVADQGFPAPFPLLKGGALATRVFADSRWPTVAVDAWFDGQLPPEARGAVDQAERAAVDSRLSLAAGALFDAEQAA